MKALKINNWRHLHEKPPPSNIQAKIYEGSSCSPSARGEWFASVGVTHFFCTKSLK